MGPLAHPRTRRTPSATLRRVVGAAIAIPLLASVVPAGCGADADGPPLVGTDVDASTGDDGGSCVASPPPAPMDPRTLPSCCTMGAAHCVPSADVVPSIAKQLATCSGGYCEPDTLIKDPSLIPATCTAFNGTPGACISVCVPQVQQYLNVLKQGTCAPDERCAPCVNPLDGTNTGACDVGKPCGATDGGSTGDAGGCPYTGPAKVDPTSFPDCSPACAGSHCVPSALVPAAEQSQLAKCPSAGPDSGGALDGFCVPDPFIASGGEGLPASCKSVAGAEGRCLSTCIPQVAGEASALPQATCASTERCAPCYNPTADDPTAPTGACSIACDKPADPPTVLSCPYTGPPVVDPSSFSACSPACGGAHCLPAALVPTSEQSQLAACPGGFCTPDSFIASGGKAVPETCTSVAGAEGRCLSVCLPTVAADVTELPQDVCAADERCAPCYNPTATDPTAPTGACSIACDKPTKPPVVLSCPWTGPPVVDPNVFPACSPACGGAHCVPSSLVSPSQQPQLATCPGGFCVPDPYTSTDGNYVPPTCTAFGDPASEGRCLSACLLPVQQQSSQLVQDVCASGDLCTPCTDPFKGTSTGACTQACDKPAKPPFTFPLCCDYQGQTQGTCIPKRLVPSSEQSSLKQDECPTNAAGYLCVPNEYLPNSTTPVQTCTTLLGKGTCVSNCANLPAGGVTFTQGTCPSNHVCVACSLAPAGTPGC